MTPTSGRHHARRLLQALAHPDDDHPEKGLGEHHRAQKRPNAVDQQFSADDDHRHAKDQKTDRAETGP
jgi:hypothetical protein